MHAERIRRKIKQELALNTILENSSFNQFCWVSIRDQQLYLFEQNQQLGCYLISTAIKGEGTLESSEKTPLGLHGIAEKIGDSAMQGMRFIGRKPCNDIVKPVALGEFSSVDAICTRILWLKGLERTTIKNSNINSQQRYIYIHGTNEEWRLGSPASHGCIRMSNHSIIDFYNKVDESCLIWIA